MYKKGNIINRVNKLINNMKVLETSDKELYMVINGASDVSYYYIDNKNATIPLSRADAERDILNHKCKININLID